VLREQEDGLYSEYLFLQQSPQKVDVTGNWTGTFANREAVLYINSQDGNSFSGILKNSKGAIVAVSGRVEPDTRQVVIQETRIIEGVKEGPAWVLGTDTGNLAVDGRRISGSGKDKAGHVYAWSFSK
jgi:hypothetical protein